MALASYAGYHPRLKFLVCCCSKPLQVDINSLTADALEPLNGDLWLLSPACQPYTILNPNAKGAADPRAQSFLHLMEEVLPALAERGAAPTRLLIENVAGFEVRGGSLTSTRLSCDDSCGK
jgi:site-specific DNA-cytosine methylase